MRNVLPLRIILDGVIEIGRPDRKRNDCLLAQAAFAIRVRICLRDPLADLGLYAIPLLLRRFLFHPTFHSRDVTAETPASIHLRLS